jgi:ankyrin repeat protein
VTIGIGTTPPSWPEGNSRFGSEPRIPFEQTRAALWSLTKNYDVGGIKDFFRAGQPTSVLERLSTGDTPLHWAARLRWTGEDVAGVPPVKGKGHGVDVLLVLLQCLPAEAVNARNADGMTPLMVAAEAGQDFNARVLLQAGALQEASDERGWTPLFLAAYAGAANVIVTLLGWHPDASGVRQALDRRDAQGNTAFMVAVANGNLEAAQELLDRGADINAVNAEGKTALMLAELSDMTTGAEIAWLVDSGADENIKDHAGMTAMQYIDATLDGTPNAAPAPGTVTTPLRR